MIIFCMHVMMAYILVDRLYEEYVLNNHTLSRHETRLSLLDSMIGHNDIECVKQVKIDRKTISLLCELPRVG